MKQLTEILLVFNADWSMKGGLSYLAERVRGNEPCELCRITYSGVTKSAEWKKCERDIRAPVRELYRNQLTGPLVELAADAPVVIAATNAGPVLLLDRATIESCDGDPNRLQEEMIAALDEQGVKVG